MSRRVSKKANYTDAQKRLIIKRNYRVVKEHIVQDLREIIESETLHGYNHY